MFLCAILGEAGRQDGASKDQQVTIETLQPSSQGARALPLPMHLGGMQRVDLGAALALLLMADPQRQIEQRAKAVFERRMKGAGLESCPPGLLGPVDQRQLAAAGFPRNLSLRVELFPNEQPCKRSDLRIWRLHAARACHRLFRGTCLKRADLRPPLVYRSSRLERVARPSKSVG
jgi:hypothetical protein